MAGSPVRPSSTVKLWASQGEFSASELLVSCAGEGTNWTLTLVCVGKGHKDVFPAYLILDSSTKIIRCTVEQVVHVLKYKNALCFFPCAFRFVQNKTFPSFLLESTGANHCRL